MPEISCCAVNFSDSGNNNTLSYYAYCQRREGIGVKGGQDCENNNNNNHGEVNNYYYNSSYDEFSKRSESYGSQTASPTRLVLLKILKILKK